MSADRPNPIIFDTDIGDNVDDALALVFACQSPELKLLGVTTVFRDTQRRGAIARALLECLGRGEVPVAAGIGKPLLGPWDRAAPKHFTIEFDEQRARLDDRHATQFVIKTLREYAAEPVTICAVGPLTNLAIALATEPALAERVRIVLMGGMISGDRCETNMAADPEAAQIVFSSGADITMVGLDVTLQCPLTKDEVGRIKSASHAHTRLLSRMIDAWMAETGRLPVPHDALAVAMCIDPSLCERRAARVAVETSGELARGRTVVQPTSDRRIRVCTSVARDRFVELFLSRVCSEPINVRTEP
jgi:inosine-uridine nucleoside N-ribohydrolase